jgi:hypothetical protein
MMIDSVFSIEVKIMITKLLTIFSSCLFLFSATSFAQLDEGLKAHGTIERFREFGTLEFDTRNSPFGKKSPLSDHHLVDLKSRKILITSRDYKIGFDGKDVWFTPKDLPLGPPARFYVSTPFYFFGLPFVLADTGTVQKPMGKKLANGKEYDAVKITFKKGVGDSPDDFYIPYFDPKNHQLALVLYIVTYLPFRQGKSVDQMEMHSIVFNEWQNVSGLVVPKKVSFHSWKDEKLGEGSGSYTYENVTFRKERPDANQFVKPDGAIVDESLKGSL